jgi:hypothetical protein
VAARQQLIAGGKMNLIAFEQPEDFNPNTQGIDRGTTQAASEPSKTH